MLRGASIKGRRRRTKGGRCLALLLWPPLGPPPPPTLPVRHSLGSRGRVAGTLRELRFPCSLAERCRDLSGLGPAPRSPVPFLGQALDPGRVGSGTASSGRPPRGGRRAGLCWPQGGGLRTWPRRLKPARPKEAGAGCSAVASAGKGAGATRHQGTAPPGRGASGWPQRLLGGQTARSAHTVRPQKALWLCVRACASVSVLCARARRVGCEWVCARARRRAEGEARLSWPPSPS